MSQLCPGGLLGAAEASAGERAVGSPSTEQPVSWLEAAGAAPQPAPPQSLADETALCARGERGQTLKTMVPLRLKVLQQSS